MQDFYNSTWFFFCFLRKAGCFLSNSCTAWCLDSGSFSNKHPSNVESSRPHPLSTTQGIRMTYFSINKDRDNGGGLLAAAVASSSSSGLRSQISIIASSCPTAKSLQARLECQRRVFPIGWIRPRRRKQPPNKQSALWLQINIIWLICLVVLLSSMTNEEEEPLLSRNGCLKSVLFRVCFKEKKQQNLLFPAQVELGKI